MSRHVSSNGGKSHGFFMLPVYNRSMKVSVSDIKKETHGIAALHSYLLIGSGMMGVLPYHYLRFFAICLSSNTHMSTEWK